MKTSVKFSELNNLPLPSEKRLEEIKAFEDKDFSDNPEWTDEDWKKARPAQVKYPKQKSIEKIVAADRVEPGYSQFEEG